MNLKMLMLMLGALALLAGCIDINVAGEDIDTKDTLDTKKESNWPGKSNEVD